MKRIVLSLILILVLIGCTPTEPSTESNDVTEVKPSDDTKPKPINLHYTEIIILDIPFPGVSEQNVQQMFFDFDFDSYSNKLSQGTVSYEYFHLDDKTKTYEYSSGRLVSTEYVNWEDKTRRNCDDESCYDSDHDYVHQYDELLEDGKTVQEEEFVGEKTIVGEKHQCYFFAGPRGALFQCVNSDNAQSLTLSVSYQNEDASLNFIPKFTRGTVTLEDVNQRTE